MILDLALCLTSTPTLCIVRAVLRSAVCFPTHTYLIHEVYTSDASAKPIKVESEKVDRIG